MQVVVQAAGAAMALVDAVVQGTSQQHLAPAGFAICRPPGEAPDLLWFHAG